MNRILLISLLISIATAVFFKVQSDNRLLRATNAENKVKDLQYAVEKYNNSQERAGKTIEKVRTIVRTIKSDCDCWNTSVDDRVRDEIRKNHK